MAHPKRKPRHHHFVPRFFLEGFTDSDGFLFVHDLGRRRRPWRVRPVNAGHQRDFYRVDVPGEEPTIAEDALQTMEDAAAPLIRRVAEEHTLPSGVDREALLWFIAVLAARVPKQRAQVSRFVTDLLKLRLEAAISTPERFAAHLQRVREAGTDVSGLSREEIKEAMHDPGMIFSVNQTWAVGRMFEDVEILAPAMVARSWSVLVAKPDAPSFICSDNPVSLLPRKPSGTWRPLGWGMPDTFAFVPLARRVALYGLLDQTLPARLPVSTRTVGMMNTATLATANKHVYSPLEDFIWAMADGHLGHVCDLPVPERRQAPPDSHGAGH